MDFVTIISAAVTSKLKTLFDDIAKDFGDGIKHLINNNILEYQVEEYNRNYCTKTLLHRVQPKNLKDFYQPLFITPCGKHRTNTFIDDSKRIPTNSISELFKKKQFITLIGNAGSGKSTIVKYLFLNAIDTDFKIPIKVELRYMNDYSGDVVSFIKEKIFKLGRLATEDKIIERLLASGDFVFFLDGYDEITSSKKEKVTKEIDDLVKLYNNNFYLLTSRPYTEIDLLPLFHNYEVCVLSDEDINQFIRKQIPVEEKELCDKIIQAVNSKENFSYKSFLSNPLLLSMFILTFQSYSSIPQKRSEFYSQVFDALYSVHDSMSKLAFVREKQSGLSKEQIVEVLKLFSFISYFDEKFIFSGLYIDEKLRFIKEKKKNISFDNINLLNDLQVAIGILNKEGTDYTFPHRSLQEYFAAIYISSLNDANKKVVYSKILTTLTGNRPFKMTSRDNFYLLLSELDEKSVIQHALIPFLEKYVARVNPDETNFEIIIDYFVTLNSIYDAFNYILKTGEVNSFHEFLNEQFYTYRKLDDKERVEDGGPAMKKLAEVDIKPFLKSYLPKVEAKCKELSEYLINENNSDTDIISII